VWCFLVLYDRLQIVEMGSVVVRIVDGLLDLVKMERVGVENFVGVCRGVLRFLGMRIQDSRTDF
jgi:hypothetical protein